MRWKSKFPPDTAKPGECWLFVKAHKWWFHFLDCGCAVWSRPYIETWKYGHTRLEELARGLEVRPHMWGGKTTCFDCLKKAMEELNGPESIDAFLVEEEDRGVHVDRGHLETNEPGVSDG